MALQASLPLVIIGTAMYGFHLLNGPVNKREMIDECSKGFHAFHQLHQLSTPASVVAPHATLSPVHLTQRHIAADGTVTHPLSAQHTTQDAVVEQRVNEHFDKRADTLNIFDRHAWRERAGEWSPAYRRMLKKEYGVTGYQVKTGPTVHVDDEMGEAAESE